METTKPASPTLQGIPLELRTEIYNYVAINEPRKVSGRRFVKKGKGFRSRNSGDLWKHFQSAIAPHPLTLTCRQMYTEFNQVLATTPGQTYNLIVNNIDLGQLDLFHRFVAAHCSSRRITEAKMQPLPLLFNEVTLHLKLDGNVDYVVQSIEDYVDGLQKGLPYKHGGVFDALSEVKILPGLNTGISGDPADSPAKPWMELQAELAKFHLSRICNVHAVYELDLKVMELMLAHFTNMVNSHE